MKVVMIESSFVRAVFEHGWSGWGEAPLTASRWYVDGYTTPTQRHQRTTMVRNGPNTYRLTGATKLTGMRVHVATDCDHWLVAVSGHCIITWHHRPVHLAARQ